jgi:ABC-2 type transport system ATP-binding protein
VTEAVIVVRGLRKTYGDHEAVRGVDLVVERGEVFAFLGPNGAGKTTTVEILEGYRSRSGGEVSELGEDPARSGRRWRDRIGVVLQECRVPALLTVREVLDMYAGYYSKRRDVDETIDLVGLSAQASQRAGKLSGGQQRRLDVALALIGDPDLLLLDEPTTGFDPAARRGAWDLIANLRSLGKSVFLTTHYMDEAQHLADRVAILKAGEIVAEGRPDQLVPQDRVITRIRFRLPPGVAAAELPPVLSDRLKEEGGRVTVLTDQPVADLAVVTSWALQRGVDLLELEALRPSLEDIYLELTGTQIA